ncbi:MAG: hypothetical protein WA913_13590 [Pricia sp.]
MKKVQEQKPKPKPKAKARPRPRARAKTKARARASSRGSSKGGKKNLQIFDFMSVQKKRTLRQTLDRLRNVRLILNCESVNL